MRIALIRRKFSAIGGAELYLDRLIKALCKERHELHLFANFWHPIDGVNIHQINIESRRRSEIPVEFATKVALALNPHSYDCIFSLERTFLQDVYRAGDGVHKVWLKQRHQFSPWWRKPFVGRSRFHKNMLLLERKLFSTDRTRYIIANSEMVRQEIAFNYGFPIEKIILVRNGVNTTEINSEMRLLARQKFGFKTDDFVFLFIGSGWERKGLKYLIKAFQQLDSHKAKLLIVGKGRIPLFAPKGVYFSPPTREIEQAYAVADAFAFLPLYEPGANVCYEALRLGIPVITSIQNGAAEVVKQGVNGSIIDSPSNINAVVNAFRYWMNTSRVFVTHANSFSIEENVKSTLEVLQMAADRKT